MSLLVPFQEAYENCSALVYGKECNQAFGKTHGKSAYLMIYWELWKYLSVTVGLTYSSLKTVLLLFCVLVVSFDFKTSSQALCDIPYGHCHLSFGASRYKITILHLYSRPARLKFEVSWLQRFKIHVFWDVLHIVTV